MNGTCLTKTIARKPSLSNCAPSLDSAVNLSLQLPTASADNYPGTNELMHSVRRHCPLLKYHSAPVRTTLILGVPFWRHLQTPRWKRRFETKIETPDECVVLQTLHRLGKIISTSYNQRLLATYILFNRYSSIMYCIYNNSLSRFLIQVFEVLPLFL